MKKKKSKLNLKPLLFLIIVIVAVFAIIKISQKHNKTNTPNQPTNGSQVSSNTEEVKEPEISEVEKINQQRKTCSEITTERNIPVLMYHFFYDAQAGETGRDNNYMEIHDFEEQIKYLAENNYYVPSWDELEDFVNGKIGLPEKSIIITVDDGDESFYKLAVPVLEKYNFYATSFLITSWYPDRPEKYTSDVIDYQSHSNNMHRAGSDGKGAILTLDYESACQDLNESKRITGDKCKVFCYPFGHYNERAKQILKDCGFTMAFTVEGGYVTPGMDLYQLPRVRMSKGISLNSFIAKIK